MNGSRRCFLEDEDTLHTSTQIMWPKSEGMMERLTGKNTEVYSCTPMYRFITLRMTDDDLEKYCQVAETMFFPD